MALVDDRGRLFGRLNVVDAFIVLFLFALVPLAYVTYALFKTPPPELTAIEPAVVEHSTEMSITVRGRDLRPYMRIVVGDHQARNFLFFNATTAEVDLPQLTPGVYDVVLYDYAQERDRLPKALTIAPPPLPSTQVEVVGAFRNLTAEQLKSFSGGMRLGDVATVTRLGKPVKSLIRAAAGEGVVEIPVDALDLPAVLRIGCALQGSVSRVQCLAGGVALLPDAYITLPTPLGDRPFQIDQVRAPVDLTTVEAHVRFFGDVQTLGLIDRGDVDIGVVRNPLASGAEVVGASEVRTSAPPQVVSTSSRDVTLRVPVQRGLTGWRYAGQELRSGASFKLATLNYEVAGTVLRVTPEMPPAAREGSQ